MQLCTRICLGLLLAALVSPAMAQEKSERLTFPHQHRGKAITVSGQLFLPAGTGKVPALIIHHGSGGISEDRELRYAHEIVKLGVATFVLDSFKPRGITSTVKDQLAVTTTEMLGDAFEALKALARHPRIDGKRVGITGFSKGGSVALLASHEVRASKALPDSLRFALHVPFYPACNTHHRQPKTSGAPILMLLGGADTYAGVAPCQEYAAALKAAGARVEVVVYPGAKHGFDGGQAYTVASGQNYSQCIFDEQADGSWKERRSGLITDRNGQRNEANFKKAIAGCRTLGVTGGPNEAARTKAMEALKGAVQQYLLDAK